MILFPTQIEQTQDYVKQTQEYVEQSQMHPCQKIALDSIELSLEFRKLLDTPRNELQSQEYYEKLGEEMERRDEQNKQLFKDSDCMDNDNNLRGDWYDEEFQEKMQNYIKRNLN